MSVRNPRAKWVLPLVVNPPTHTDWCVPVPDDPFHKAAFLGALQSLGSSYQWQRDAAHTASAAARVWRDIADNLERCMTEKTALNGAEIEDFMPLRVDCDCNVFVTCCDGTEKQILTSAQVQALVGGSAVSGAPQPPAGGCQTYDNQIVNGGAVLLPTPVSTNDTIEIMSADGATAPDLVTWFCPNGQFYFGGTCVGSTTLDGAAILPATPVGQIIVKLGATYYPLVIGTPFTVPAGVASIQPILLMNYNPAASVHGTISFKAKVCNVSAATFDHVFDFSTGTQGWAISTGSFGAYVPGTGFQYTQAPGAATFIEMDIIRAFAARDLTEVIVNYQWSPNGVVTVVGTLEYLAILAGVPTTLGAQPTPSGSGILTYDDARALPTCTSIDLEWNIGKTSTGGGTVVIFSVELKGIGTDPF